MGSSQDTRVQAARRRSTPARPARHQFAGRSATREVTGRDAAGRTASRASGPPADPVAAPSPLAEAAVAAVRRPWLDPLRERVGATTMRLAWVIGVGVATVALLGVAPPREAGGLMVAAVGMLLVIRPVLLICLGDPTLFDPDAVESPTSSADDRA